MKKIVPFNNILEFNTDVKEITAISLEHTINKYPDMINGVFYISGEYKITEGLLDKEKFNFELPFDIALSTNYKLETLLIDIDDFRYDLISDKKLKVNIDLYIDGEEELKKEPIEETREDIEKPEEILNLIEELTFEKEPEKEEKTTIVIEKNEEKLDTYVPERIELLQEMITSNKEEEKMPTEINIKNENKNNNSLEGNQEEKYVTYRVYTVLDTDTLDIITSKYNITKEMLSDYNNIENIKPGDKLLIPTNEK